MHFRSFIALFALAFLTGCGGDSGEDTGSAAGADGAKTDTSATIAFDADALPTTTILLPGDAEAPVVTPVFADTCAVLPSDDVSTITSEVDREFGLGSARTFDSVNEGASCLYTDDAFKLRITVGFVSQVKLEPDGPAAWLPPPNEKVSQSVWTDAADVTLLSTGGFGAGQVEFAAYLPAGDLGVYVANARGTALDASNEGVLWGRLAQAAAARVMDLERVVSTAPTDTTPPPLEDLCGLYTSDEVAAFFDVSGETFTCTTVASSAQWQDGAERRAIRIAYLDERDVARPIDDLAPAEAGSTIQMSQRVSMAVYLGETSGLQVWVTDVSLYAANRLHGSDAAVAVLQNILDRRA